MEPSAKRTASYVPLLICICLLHHNISSHHQDIHMAAHCVFFMINSITEKHNCSLKRVRFEVFYPRLLPTSDVRKYHNRWQRDGTIYIVRLTDGVYYAPHAVTIIASKQAVLNCTLCLFH